jgi:hypothetical protein
MYSKIFDSPVRSGTFAEKRGTAFREAAPSVYAPASAALDGVTVEPPPHAEHIASATRAPAYLTKPAVFITLFLLGFGTFFAERSWMPAR